MTIRKQLKQCNKAWFSKICFELDVELVGGGFPNHMRDHNFRIYTSVLLGTSMFDFVLVLATNSRCHLEVTKNAIRLHHHYTDLLPICSVNNKSSMVWASSLAQTTERRVLSISYHSFQGQKKYKSFSLSKAEKQCKKGRDCSAVSRSQSRQEYPNHQLPPNQWIQTRMVMRLLLTPLVMKTLAQSSHHNMVYEFGPSQCSQKLATLGLYLLHQIAEENIHIAGPWLLRDERSLRYATTAPNSIEQWKAREMRTRE